MEKLFEIYNKGAYNKVFRDDNSVDMVTVKNNLVTHKQIEMKNGRVYMRMKKRDLLSCS